MSSRDTDEVEARNRAAAEAREFDPYPAEFLEREHEVYDTLRQHLPIARSERMTSASLGSKPGGWVATRYEDGTEILRNPEVFSSQSGDYPVRPWIPQAIDPPMHTGYRRIFNPWFTADAVSKLEPHLQQYAEDLVGRMIEKEAFDFVADFADPFPTVIFCELMGFPSKDYERLMNWKNTIMHPTDGHPRGHDLAVAKARTLGFEVDPGRRLADDVSLAVRNQAAQEVYAYFADLLDERRASPQDDLVTRLLDSRFEGERPLTQEELEDTLFLFFMGGLDTVASTLGLIVETFARNEPKRREFIALMEDPRKVSIAIEELVRVHSIVLLPRRVTRDFSLHGALFRKDDQVLVPTQAANMDPEEFPNPHEIDLERFPNRHVGFGLGPHRCLGIHLARRELRIALQVFHRKLPDYQLDPTSRPIGFGGMKGLASLPLVKG
jgi:cytochrome P450